MIDDRGDALSQVAPCSIWTINCFSASPENTANKPPQGECAPLNSNKRTMIQSPYRVPKPVRGDACRGPGLDGCAAAAVGLGDADALPALGELMPELAAAAVRTRNGAPARCSTKPLRWRQGAQGR